MNRLAIKITAIAAALVVAFALGYGSASRKASTKATAFEAKANEAKGAADALKTQAQSKDEVVSNTEPRLARARAKLAYVEAEAGIRSQFSASSHETCAPEPAFELVAERVDNLAPVVAAQREVIAAQDEKIVALEASRNAWRASCQAREVEALNLRAALAARSNDRPWSAGNRLERKWDGTTQAGITARRDIGPGYVEVSGFGDRAGVGFGWRW